MRSPRPVARIPVARPAHFRVPVSSGEKEKETPNQRGSRRGRSKSQEAFPVSTEKERRVCQVQSRARSTRHGRPNRALPSGISRCSKQATGERKERKKKKEVAIAIASATSEATASVSPSIHPPLAAHLGRRGLDVSCCTALVVWCGEEIRHATGDARPVRRFLLGNETAVW